MKKFLLPTWVMLLLYACHSVQPSAVDQAPSSDTTKKNYLPVGNYLKWEMAAVDSFPLRIMKYQVSHNKTDSALITTADFNQLAREFLRPELDSSSFEKNFEENSFVDQSTNLVSFTYSTKDTGNGLKRVDVLLSPVAGSDKLNSIYMEAVAADKDSSVISKLTWKAGRNFRILHINQPKNGPETTSQTLVVWDNRD